MPSPAATLPGAGDRLGGWWMLGLLFLVVCAYWPVFTAGFVWNDADYVTSPALRGSAGLGRIWGEPGATEQYYPLLHSVFWLQSAAWGDHATGYHAVNLAFHLGAAFLFHALLVELQLSGARMATALFALHPVGVESVAWISEQKNTLSLCFALGAAWSYLRYERTRRISSYLAASVLFVAALLSKSVAATLPGALLVLGWWRRGTLNLRADGLPLAPWLLIGGAFGFFTAWVERVHVGAAGADFALNWAERLVLAGRIPWFYGRTVAWPAHLNFIYPRWALDAHSLAQWIPVLLTVVTLVLAWWMRHRARAPLAVLLLFGGILFPVLGLFPVYGMRFSFVADHWVYHAALVVFAAAGGVVHRAIRWKPGMGCAAVMAVLLPLACQSRLLAYSYRTAVDLYQHTLELNPAAWMAHNNLGTERLHAREFALAEKHFIDAVRLKPDYFDAWNNLGLAVDAQGRLAEATAHFRRAAELNPGYAAAHVNFGNALFAATRYVEAEVEYRAALRLDPILQRARYNLAVTVAAQGRTREAIPEYERVLEADPGADDARFNLAGALLEVGDASAAATHYRVLLSRAPSADVHNNLGNALLASGDIRGAEGQFRRAIELAPAMLPARANLVRALHRSGNLEEAERQLEIMRRMSGR